MTLHLAAGALDEAGTEAETIAKLMSMNRAGDTFFGLWHVITRVKWMYRIGEVNNGLKAATAAISKAQQFADQTLISRLQLLAAEGFARLDRVGEAAALLAEVSYKDNAPTPELVAEMARVTGRIVARSKQPAASAYFDRSGTMLTGGKITDGKQSGTNLQGTKIDGGTRINFNPGDFIMVPSGVPHQFVDLKTAVRVMSMYLPNVK